MLILTRRQGEAIVFEAAKDIPAGTRIRLVVCRPGGTYVHLGIEAPRSVDVIREELLGPPAKEAK